MSISFILINYVSDSSLSEGHWINENRLRTPTFVMTFSVIILAAGYGTRLQSDVAQLGQGAEMAMETVSMNFCHMIKL